MDAAESPPFLTAFLEPRINNYPLKLLKQCNFEIFFELLQVLPNFFKQLNKPFSKI